MCLQPVLACSVPAKILQLEHAFGQACSGTAVSCTVSELLHSLSCQHWGYVKVYARSQIALVWHQAVPSDCT